MTQVTPFHPGELFRTTLWSIVRTISKTKALDKCQNPLLPKSIYHHYPTSVRLNRAVETNFWEFLFGKQFSKYKT